MCPKAQLSPTSTDVSARQSTLKAPWLHLAPPLPSEGIYGQYEWLYSQ